MKTNFVGYLFFLFGLVVGTPTPCTYGGVPTRNNGYRLAAWLENAPTGNFFDVQLSQTEAIPACATVVYDFFDLVVPVLPTIFGSISMPP